MNKKIEYLNLYDKDGNLQKEKGIRGKKTKYLKGIVMIFIENSKGEFLIQKTSKSRGSIHATTGGHVEYGSNFLDSVINEVKEELGIDIRDEKIEELYTYIWEMYYQKVYYLKKDIDIKNITIEKEEVEYIKWLSKEEINELINNNEFREGNIEGYKHILKLKEK